MISNLTHAEPRRLLPSASATKEDIRLATRRGTRGLMAAIGLGLLVWLLTGVAVSIVVLR
ncbi:MAG: hypothetical protein AB7O95_18980 [Geminicoccaceae bacterium]